MNSLLRVSEVFKTVTDLNEFRSQIARLVRETVADAQGTLFLTGDLVINIDSEVLAKVRAERQAVIKNGPISIMCAPVISSGVMHGSIYLFRAGSESAFHPDDLLKLQEVAGIAAIGLGLAHRIRGLVYERDLLHGQLQVDDRIVGNSKAFEDLRKSIDRAAASDEPVMIFGPSGSGRQLTARNIHNRSGRAHRPFLRIDCDLAAKVLNGDFQRADGGTLFVDEIDFFPMKIQARLQRLLEDGTFEPLEFTDSRKKVDVRVIASTNDNPALPIRSDEMLENLVRRLRKFTISVPVVRRDSPDIESLVDHFLRKHAPQSGIDGISPDALDALVAHDWHGNIAKLENVVRLGTFLDYETEITVEDLPRILTDERAIRYDSEDETDEAELPLRDRVAMASRAEVERALRESKTRKEAAHRLEISPATLYRLKGKLGL